MKSGIDEWKGMIYGRCSLVDYLEQLRQKVTPVTPEVTRGKRIVRYEKGSVGDAVRAAKELKAKENLYVYPSAEGMAIGRQPPPFGIQHIIVKPDGTHQVVSAGASFEAGRKAGVEPISPVAIPKAEAENPVIYGWLTPSLAEELKRLMEITEWPPPEEPSPTFSVVLQVCDYAFTLKALKRKTYEMDVGKSGHKKILIVRLLNAEEEEVTDIAQRTIAELEARGNEDKEWTLEEVTDIARKVVGA